jgi:glycosyltransferase involved in cell wall biosynthesis
MTRQPVVVVPAYREHDRVGDTIRAILKVCDAVVVVDDGSGDGTAEAARSAGADVVVHEKNRGKGVALQTGFRRAQELNAGVVITLDADGQHDPDEIQSFLHQYASSGQEVIVGNRMTNKGRMPLVRRVTNRLMSLLLSVLMKQWVPDTQNGYRLYAAEALPFVEAESRGFAAESEQLLYLAYRGFRIGSVPVRTIYGDEKSKIHPFRDTIRFLNMIARYYRHRSRERA